MNVLDCRHAKNNMPQFFNQPPNAIIVRQISGGNPPKNPDIISFRPLLNPLPRHGKLCTALVRNIRWHLTRVDIQEIA